MKLRLCFGHTQDELFLVTAGQCGSKTHGAGSTFTVSTYDHEDTFLGLAMLAALEDRELFDVVHAVLLTINAPVFPQRWVEVDLTAEQGDQLGMNVAEFFGEVPSPWVDQTAALQDFFSRVPMPLVILMGPEHHFTFINQLYVDLMRRESRASVLGKSVREALPELKGQPFFKLLDTVYKTGVPYVGREVPGTIRREANGDYEDAVFDFLYHPLRNDAGEVEGILVQAKDVTVEVLARQVSAERETQLFRQWMELEAIYQAAPVALSLVDAKSFRFLRANRRLAEIVGSEVETMVGQCALGLGDRVPGAHEMFERAARGERLDDVELEGELATRPGVRGSWKVSLTPLYDACGGVAAIMVAATETTAMKQAEARLIESEQFVAAGVMAESLVRKIASPVEELKALLAVVRAEIRRPEALKALAAAEEKLEDIAGVTSEAARRYGVRSEEVAMKSGAGR